MNRYVRDFKTSRRIKHNENKVIQVKTEKNYLGNKKGNFLVLSLTVSNVFDNYKAYVENGFKPLTLICCEIDYKKRHAMYRSIKKIKDKNADIRVKIGDIFKTVFSFKHIDILEIDGTEALHTLIKKGFFQKMDKIFKSNILSSKSCIELMYENARTTEYYKEDKDIILAKYLTIPLMVIGRNNGYLVTKIHDRTIKDVNKRTMNTVVYGIIKSPCGCNRVEKRLIKRKIRWNKKQEE